MVGGYQPKGNSDGSRPNPPNTGSGVIKPSEKLVSIDRRISRHQAFMQTAEVWSQRATCFRRNVGAVIVVGNNIVSIGYNGPPSGAEHCTGKGCADPERGCTRSVHAEHNAIERSPTQYRTLNIERSLYTTESPCIDCARLIISERGMSPVYYLHEYRDRRGIDILLEAGVNVYRMTPSGFLIDCRNGELTEDHDARTTAV
jgi:dCMP deaminase